MKIKVAELEGAKLDYWVAKAEGHILKRSLRDGWQEVRTNDDAQFFLGFHPSNPNDKNEYWYEDFYSPSTSWSQGGPIHEREGINIWQSGDRKSWDASARWWQTSQFNLNGPTPLIAAMRCFVASKFGEEVEELVTSIHIDLYIEVMAF
ncbi:Protein of unknown function [Nitrosospira multiformis]|uniref:DUF2591 domain-containing protein n=1 Tax=Nitrosospira multiformis TaxID=1231 RepID=A0A1H8IXY4_9PROT|nr:DUF2591 domain-containing protein [Nitrosospira multiformis]SEN72896.1 Protein of unknown function [Nitrosospira multiformis]